MSTYSLTATAVETSVAPQELSRVSTTDSAFMFNRGDPVQVE